MFQEISRHELGKDKVIISFDDNSYEILTRGVKG